jgi:rhamnosyltransferase
MHSSLSFALDTSVPQTDKYRGVCAVIVSFQPDLQKLKQLIEALQPQVDDIILVDNGSDADIVAWTKCLSNISALHVYCLGLNVGIAAAQNLGLKKVSDLLSSYVIFFDQDSCPAPDMIQQLLRVLIERQKNGEKIASVGPRFIDDRLDNPPPFVRIRGVKYERQPCISSHAVVLVDYLIASGCLVPMSTFAAVGTMQEELFIDYVDIEWGLRAKSQGFVSYGVCAAHMYHNLGDKPIAFAGKYYPARSAIRHYYMFRNAVWMYRQPWLSLNWKIADGWRLLLKYGFYLLFDKPRSLSWKMIHKGLWHGCIRRMGKIND